jgi:hypothetical protein
MLDSEAGMSLLVDFLRTLEERDRQEAFQSIGVQLLTACYEIFDGQDWISSKALLKSLVDREEERWATISDGRPMTPRRMSDLLKEYNIKPGPNRERTARGYSRFGFLDAWQRYAPHLFSIPETGVQPVSTVRTVQKAAKS